MAITIEPGLYLPHDDETLPPWARGIGIRIEDDVAVSDDGHDVLTASALKAVDAMERC